MKRVAKPSAGLSFCAPEFVIRVQLVVLVKKRKSLFGTALAGITSSVSTQAKSNAARGKLDFFLRNKFLYLHGVFNVKVIVV